MQDLRAVIARWAADLPDTSGLVFDTLPPGVYPLLAAALRERRGRPVVLVTEGRRGQEACLADACALLGAEAGVLSLPAYEALPNESTRPDPLIAGARLRTLLALAGDAAPPPLVITCIQALMQPAVSPAALAAAAPLLTPGLDWPLEQARARLAAAGYRWRAEVTEPGTAAVKGGIVDLWCPGAEWPLRVEILDDRIETLREFDPAEQRSIRRCRAARLIPADEGALRAGADADAATPCTAAMHLPAPAVWVWCGAGAVADHAILYARSAAERPDGPRLLPLADLRAWIEARGDVNLWIGADHGVGAVAAPDAGWRDLEGVPALTAGAFDPDAATGLRRRRLGEWAALARAGRRVLVCFDTEGAAAHFREWCDPEWLALFQVRVAALTQGFQSERFALVVASESELYGRRKTAGWRAPDSAQARALQRQARRITDPSEIEPGDLVVHAEHGIGRYDGVGEIEVNGQTQEVLTLEYADNARLHVPLLHIHLLSRYIGLPGYQVELHRLGGRRWAQDRAMAEAGIADLAAQLLETQAQRRLVEGFAFPSDTLWQREFEAAFPYRDTPDQERITVEIKADMESARPMDRLVCGDAGYGKTEVAMRAAFKCVMAGKQVAMLVPTTVLAQQHGETFAERMAAYPVRVETLSRFRGAGERAALLRDLAVGGVDIVIGTHALLQRNVRFKDLGLVIVDEEQRFGVRHKERLKELRRLVDILTLTATPIPRTLYQSLTGIRDMSLLQTPPSERMAIETIVTRDTDRVVREAILRELNREGQVFFLHNRVRTLDRVHERLARLAPEARIVVAHGQMAAHELAAVMHAFVAGDYDVLLCTTIIESGMNIPRVNTILIDRADTFGIADLYQLRGRVGRARERAYAYLLLPHEGLVDAEARARLAAITRHTGQGAGFNLAMRDLEIRGAGNLLGAAQSGHIAAIGFGLYCQLLRRTVSQLKGEAPPPLANAELRLDFIELTLDGPAPNARAVLPYEYIEDEKLRLDAFRRLAEAATIEDVRAIERDLRDRFGAPPGPVKRLLTLARIRALCVPARISAIEVREDKVMLTREGELVTAAGKLPRLRGGTVEQRLTDLARLVEACAPRA